MRWWIVSVALILEKQLLDWQKRMDDILERLSFLPEGETKTIAFRSRLEGMDNLIAHLTEIDYANVFGKDYEPEVEIVREWHLEWVKDRRMKMAKIVGVVAN